MLAQCDCHGFVGAGGIPTEQFSISNGGTTRLEQKELLRLRASTRAQRPLPRAFGSVLRDVGVVKSIPLNESKVSGLTKDLVHSMSMSAMNVTSAKSKPKPKVTFRSISNVYVDVHLLQEKNVAMNLKAAPTSSKPKPSSSEPSLPPSHCSSINSRPDRSQFLMGSQP